MEVSQKWMIVLALFATFFLITSEAVDKDFEQNYYVTWGWGNNRVLFLDDQGIVQLAMDNSSGAGFGSKAYYGSGYFNMSIKIPNRDTAGVVTAFYLSSNEATHDELDFEFLGNREGKNVTLQTNVFANGTGNREQRIHLWFDPSADFHSYGILWNERQIVFFVDETPIRIFKNNRNIGVSYPSKPMQILVSLWNGEWATDGGQTKIDWAYAPFKAQFKGFGINGCQLPQNSGSNLACINTSGSYWWNGKQYWELNPNQLKAYEDVKKQYMNYDYCTDRNRYPKPPPECSHQIRS